MQRLLGGGEHLRGSAAASLRPRLIEIDSGFDTVYKGGAER